MDPLTKVVIKKLFALSLEKPDEFFDMEDILEDIPDNHTIHAQVSFIMQELNRLAVGGGMKVEQEVFESEFCEGFEVGWRMKFK